MVCVLLKLLGGGRRGTETNAWLSTQNNAAGIKSTRKNSVLLLAPTDYIIDDVLNVFGFVMAEDVTTTIEISTMNEYSVSHPSRAPHLSTRMSRVLFVASRWPLTVLLCHCAVLALQRSSILVDAMKVLKKTLDRDKIGEESQEAAKVCQDATKSVSTSKGEMWTKAKSSVGALSPGAVKSLVVSTASSAASLSPVRRLVRSLSLSPKERSGVTRSETCRSGAVLWNILRQKFDMVRPSSSIPFFPYDACLVLGPPFSSAREQPSLARTPQFSSLTSLTRPSPLTLPLGRSSCSRIQTIIQSERPSSAL
jgi:hypothetical protein